MDQGFRGADDNAMMSRLFLLSVAALLFAPLGRPNDQDLSALTLEQLMTCRWRELPFIRKRSRTRPPA